jgi:5-formyltetrahydrofolate cyclo-ligase
MSDAGRASKRALRAEMRALRRAIDDPAERSVALWSHVRDEPSVRSARSVMVFNAIPGEPDTTLFARWCTSLGKHVVAPDPDPSAAFPVDPRSLDVVVVPGLAFTASGERLGQGGGWYDRFLAGVRDDCVTIGVAFAEQVVDELPVELHDVRLTRVVTDAGPADGRTPGPD